MSRCPWCGGAYRAEPLAEFDIDGEPNTLCACGERCDDPQFLTDYPCDWLGDEDAPEPVDPASCVVGWNEADERSAAGASPTWGLRQLLAWVALVAVASCAGRAMW
jgi:hypothetical protein